MKSSQSILNLLNLINPFEIKPPLTNEEAQYLYDIWKQGSRDHFGRIVISSYMPCINTLKSKGILQTDHILNGLAIKITTKGKDIIKQMVLYGEKSSLDNDNGQINYEQIYRNLGKIQKQSNKIASVFNSNNDNWLKKICK